ncbi:MAG TPA: helix-turn-helix transcriptional regulator [Pseudolysinimonas sp.]|nr:helix-turn-helix transcriptional regulator [Pseudolysinimonas sp.]
MTISIGEERATRNAPQHALEIAVESDDTGLRVRFTRQAASGDASPGPAELRVLVPLELVAADERCIDQLVAASDAGTLPPEIVEVVVAQFQADLSARLSGDEPAFVLEVHWAAVVATCVCAVSRRRPSAERLTDARRAQVARIVDRYCADAALTPDAIARALGVSRRTLYLLTAHLGGLADYIRTIRVLRALDLLQDPACELSLQQIAQQTGFPSPKAMSRALVRLVGDSPGRLRCP